MHVRQENFTRRIAYLAMLLALNIVLLYGGVIISVNTLIFMALAAFCTALACMIGGIHSGLLLIGGTAALGLILLPQKEELLTYAGLALYVLLMEEGEPKLAGKISPLFMWILKLGIFNLFFIPGLLLFPQLFLDQITWWLLLIAGMAGNVILVMLDILYHRFMLCYRRKLRQFFIRHTGVK